MTRRCGNVWVICINPCVSCPYMISFDNVKQDGFEVLEDCDLISSPNFFALASTFGLLRNLNLKKSPNDIFSEIYFFAFL